MSGVMLPWSSCVKAEESATVHVGESANVSVHSVGVDRHSPGVENLETSAIVAAIGTESQPIHTGPYVSDAAHLDASQGDQYSQLDLAGSQDMRSLDIVDTGSSVEFPNAVGELGGSIDGQKANVDPGDQPVTDSNEVIEQSDQPLVTGTSTELPVTVTADVQTQVDDAGSQLNDVSSDVASEESAGLPYAVVLALLALIGLVPVARRKDHHHV